jgi:four helix bundle protein
MSSSFKDLRVWQEAMKLVYEVYRVTVGFPKHEVYGLTQQMRRAAVSVPSNIAEGKGHRSDREFTRFLFHARGSLLELQTQILIAGTTIFAGRTCAGSLGQSRLCLPRLERPDKFAERQSRLTR